MIGSVELTCEEVQVIHNALRTYLSDYGQDEADVLHHIKSAIQRIESEAANRGAIS